MEKYPGYPVSALRADWRSTRDPFSRELISTALVAKEHRSGSATRCTLRAAKVLGGTWTPLQNSCTLDWLKKGCGGFCCFCKSRQINFSVTLLFLGDTMLNSIPSYHADIEIS